MITTEQLIRVCGKVNLRVHKGDPTPDDLILLDELEAQGVDQLELPVPDELPDGSWHWIIFSRPRVTLIQYSSGRCALIQEPSRDHHGIPLAEAIE